MKRHLIITDFYILICNLPHEKCRSCLAGSAGSIIAVQHFQFLFVDLGFVGVLLCRQDTKSTSIPNFSGVYFYKPGAILKMLLYSKISSTKNFYGLYDYAFEITTTSINEYVGLSIQL
jgi:hypothetical protein